MSSAKTTTNHDTIKQWVEARGGCPAHVKSTGSGDDPGILRIDYPGFSGVKTLEPIEWDEFFEAFEANNLAFLYQDEDNSRFSKFVSRERAELDDQDEQVDHDEQGNGRASSGTDAVTLLEAQHREVESLFQQLSEAESTREKSELFAELADNLAAHAKIEETIFYPAVCDDDTLALLHEAVEEHLAVKRVIADLLELEPSDAEFMTKVEVLEELVNDHVEEEESELFERARALEGVDLEVLGKQMKRRFDKLLESEPRAQVPKEIDAAASLPC